MPRCSPRTTTARCAPRCWSLPNVKPITRTTKVFMNVLHVHRKGADPSAPGSYRFRAEWVARGSSSQVYVSKVCETQGEAIALARKWFSVMDRGADEAARFPATFGGGHGRYEDTTDRPERFG